MLFILKKINIFSNNFQSHGVGHDHKLYTFVQSGVKISNHWKSKRTHKTRMMEVQIFICTSIISLLFKKSHNNRIEYDDDVGFKLN